MSNIYHVDEFAAYVAAYLHQESNARPSSRTALVGRFLVTAVIASSSTAAISHAMPESRARRPALLRPRSVDALDSAPGSSVGGQRRKGQAGEPSSTLRPDVVRAIRDVVDEPLADADSGALLEGYLLHELRAAIAYQGLGGEISYWNTPGSKEIDFVWTKGSRSVAIEVKNSRRWRSEYAKTINEFLDAGIVTRGFVVYRGSQRYRSGGVDGVPFEEFLSMVSTGEFAADRGAQQ